MKKHFKKATAILLALLMVTTTISDLPFTVSAAEVTDDSVSAVSGTTGDCTWELNENGTLTISGNGAMDSYIPRCPAPWSDYEINKVVIEYGVTSIGNHAFSNSKMTNITIPNSVKSIGKFAFLSCTNLKDIIIPDGITSIEEGVFYDCKIVESMDLPDTITNIDYCAFKGCTKLESITIPESVTEIGNMVFDGCSNLTIYGKPGSYAETYANSITTPFVDMYGIVDSGITGECTWTLYNGGTLIISGNGAMGSQKPWKNYKYTKIIFEDGVTSLGGLVFSCSSNLSKIIISKSVTSISYNSFDCCHRLTSITVDENNPVYDSRNNCNAIIKTNSNELIFGCKMTTIPNSVTSIGSNAFCFCVAITDITIPDSVTSIGAYAFYNCVAITDITIPDSVITIGYHSFSSCSKLSSIHIGSGVTSISPAFFGCKNLSNITVSENNPKYDSRNNCNAIIQTKFNSLYYGCKNTVIPDTVTSISSYAFSHTSLKKITIPENVTSIGSCAFSDTSLTEITIPENVTSIGSYAFSDTSLKEVSIPESVTNIGDHAFSNTSLTKITIPKNVTHIGYSAFGGCKNLSKITVSENNSKYDSRNNCNAIIETGNSNLITGCKNTVVPNSVTSIGNSAFYGCSSLTRIDIPNSVMSIGDRAFYGCSSLTRIDIPNSVTSIGYGAFYGCSSLTRIDIPNGVTSIRNSAFKYCTSLTEITIPESVTNIDYEAFMGCSNLAEINIIDSLTNIGSRVFLSTKWYKSQPDGIVYAGKVAYSYKGTMPENTSLTLKEGTVGIAEEAFYGFTNLTEIIIPEGVEVIGNHAFYGCPGLTSIVIPSSVTSIGDYAFYGCVNLEAIDIPDSLANIGYKAFEKTRWYEDKQNGIVYAGNVFCNYKGDVSTVTSLTLKEETLGIAAGALSNCENLTEIEIPEGVQIIGAGAFFGCKKLEKGKIIPRSITSIGSYAFAFCDKLENITIPYSIKSIGHYAFINCSSLKSITIPPSVKSIGIKAFGYSTEKSFDNYEKFEDEVEKSDSDIVFTKIEDFSIKGKYDSKAHIYAQKNGFVNSFIPIEYKFSWGSDNWNFNNDASSFSDATIQDGIIDTLAGSSYFNVGDDKYNNKTIDQKVKTGPGKCFGMTVSEILVKQGLLNIDSVLNIDSESSHEDEPKKNLSEYSISNNNNLITVISFIQALQNYGKYGQIRRQEGQSYQTTKEASQETFIEAAESELKNNDSLVLIEYAYQDSDPNNIDTNKVLLNEKYHAVLGYGIENLSENYHSDVTGKDYNKRVLIADPNYLVDNEGKSYLYGDACIYYNDDGNWICPYWNKNRNNTKCYWNAGSTTNRDDKINYTGRIKNIIKIYSLTDVVDLVYTSTDYVAGITIFNKSKNKTTIEKVPGTGDQNPENSEIIPYSLCDENENDAELYALPDATADYSVSFDNKPTNYSMMMDYENVSYFAKVENGTSTTVKPSGYINLNGNNIKNYSLTMMTGNSNNESDWYSITVSGNNTNSVTLSKQENGDYLLETDTPGNVSVTVENADGKTSASFKASKNSLIFKEGNTICVKADKDENGEFETLVNLVFDVNFDCAVDIRDVTTIQKYLAEMNDSEKLNLDVADMDNDGIVGIEDATKLQYYLAEL